VVVALPRAMSPTLARMRAATLRRDPAQLLVVGLAGLLELANALLLDLVELLEPDLLGLLETLMDDIEDSLDQLPAIRHRGPSSARHAHEVAVGVMDIAVLASVSGHAVLIEQALCPNGIFAISAT
jgi:hypothetical protein